MASPPSLSHWRVEGVPVDFADPRLPAGRPGGQATVVFHSPFQKSWPPEILKKGMSFLRDSIHGQSPWAVPLGQLIQPAMPAALLPLLPVVCGYPGLGLSERVPSGPQEQSVEGGAALCCPNLILWFTGCLGYTHCRSLAGGGVFHLLAGPCLSPPTGLHGAKLDRSLEPRAHHLETSSSMLVAPGSSQWWAQVLGGLTGRVGCGRQAPQAGWVIFPYLK